MSLTRLVVNNLRNLESVDINLSPELNIFYGQNGAGKSSLLESISILGMARSFRSHRQGSLIQSGKETMNVFGLLNSGRSLGYESAKEGSRMKVAGKLCTSAAELAYEMPLVAIHSQSIDLISGPPKGRRQLLDWLVFHVKPQFLHTWRRWQSCLKHRNSLLRNGRIAASELDPWDQQLSILASEIDVDRKSVFELLKVGIQSMLSDISEFDAIEIQYYRGWNKDLEYREVLDKHQEQDLQRGFTQVGPHRAEIKITSAGSPASEVLSRGQQKLLAIALLLAQGGKCSSDTGKGCVYLIDDLPSELDSNSRELVSRWLDRFPAQVFVTGIEKQALLKIWPNKKMRTFHVEQGAISPCND